MKAINKIIYFSRSRQEFLMFLLSLISFIFILFNIISLNVLLGFSQIVFLDLLYQTAVILSTIFAVLLLPSYPLYFIIFKKMNFNSLEKLTFTLITNLSYYILVGYIGFYIGLEITALLFYLAIIIPYSIFTVYIILKENKNGKFNFLRARFSLDSMKSEYQSFSLIRYFKKRTPFNGFLLIIFVILLCVLNIIRYDHFFGTDPWLHSFMIKSITEMNYLPLDEYFGTVGLHIYGAVIHFFSGVDILLIPRYFIFYAFFIITLVIYNLLIRIFKNKNVAYLGTFIMSYSSLGLSYINIQFWPTSICLTQSLFIFYVLYVRLQDFMKIDRPTRKEVLSNTIIIYTLLTMVFIGALLSHSLIAMIMLISYIFVWLIYFLKDFFRGIDFIFLLILTGIFLLFFNFTPINQHFFFISSVNLPWYLYVGAGIGGGILIWRLQNSIMYTTGRFTHTIEGGEYRYYKFIEDKIIVPFAFLVVILFISIMAYGSIIVYDVSVSSLLTGFEFLIFPTFGIWGYVLYQKKPRGKAVFVWAIIFGIALIGIFVFDALTSNEKVWTRILYISTPIIMIGFCSYVYKLVKLKSFKKVKPKVLLFFIVAFSLFATYYHQFSSVDEFEITKSDVSVVTWYYDYNDDTNAIIYEFGWNLAFVYFGYPYEEDNEALRRWDLEYFLKRDDLMLIPENHIDADGTNLLRALKDKYGTDLYILLDDYFFSNQGWAVFNSLSDEQIEAYFQMDYINRICSSKDQNGESRPLYLVI